MILSHSMSISRIGRIGSSIISIIAAPQAGLAGGTPGGDETNQWKTEPPTPTRAHGLGKCAMNSIQLETAVYQISGVGLGGSYWWRKKQNTNAQGPSAPRNFFKRAPAQAS